MSGRLPDHRVRPALSLQRWERIAFLHWRYPVEALQPLVPSGLEVQQLDGTAWLGLTPFLLGGLRVPGLPAVPGWSAFAETNLRTYVTDGEHDGVLFLRVHCARRIVTAGLRAALGLPYAYVPGTVRSQRGTTTYNALGAGIVVRPGDRVVADPLVASLTGRWAAFTRHAGVLWRIPIEHEPWPLHEARLLRFRTDMFALTGLPAPRNEPVVHFSPGVKTKIGAPRLAARPAASTSGEP